MNELVVINTNDNGLNIFDYEGSDVRTIIRDGEPWFVAADVCAVLGIGNSRMATDRLDDDEKDGVSITDTIGRSQTVTAINESGIYSLIMTSRKPEAKVFKKWVTSEVLPAIRRTGAYSTQQKPPTTYLTALKELVAATEANERLALVNKEQQERIAYQEPKVAICNVICDIDDDMMPMADVARFFGGFGVKNFFKLLRKHKLLMGGEPEPTGKYAKSGHNQPYQTHQNAGYYAVKAYERFGQMSNQTYVKPKGIIWLGEQLVELGYIRRMADGSYRMLKGNLEDWID
jgi:prophage antirepressor-like protein